MAANMDPLTNGSYWGPIEPPEFVKIEKIYFISGFTNTAFTTAQLIFYIMAMRVLWRDRFRGKHHYFLMAYSTTLACLDAIINILADLNNVRSWINFRNFPGGPLGYIGATANNSVNITGICALVVGNILADSLLLYRCRVIWGASYGFANSLQLNLVMVFPAIVALAAFSMGIVFAIQNANPGGILTAAGANLGLAYFTLSLGLNLLLTGMIVYRIWRHQRIMREMTRGQELYDHDYTSITSMFVESAAGYTIVLIPLLTTFALNSPYAQIFLGISAPVQMMCTYNIIWRVAQNRAWSVGTVNGTSSLVFKTSSRTNTTANMSQSKQGPPLQLKAMESGSDYTEVNSKKHAGTLHSEGDPIKEA